MAVSGSTVTLTLATEVEARQTVTVSYAPPTGMGATPIRDVAENPAGALTNRAVTNNTPDRTPPVLSTATVNGAALVLTYDEALDDSSEPGASAFTVTVDGTTRNLSGTNAVAVSGSTVTLTLATEVEARQTVTVSYAPPTGMGATPIRDVAENPAGPLTNRAVTNNTPDERAPVLSTATVNGARLELTYDEALDDSSEPEASAFTVRVNGTTRNLRGTNPVDVSGSKVTLTLVTAVEAGQTVTVSYTPPTGMGATPIRDAAENPATSLTNRAVTNNTDDTVAPVLVSAAVAAAGTELLMTFNEALDADSANAPPSGAFAVTVAGAPVAVSSAAVTESTKVKLSGFSLTIRQGQAVTVAYTDPGTGDDLAAIQDTAGNDAATFTTGVSGVPAVVNGSTVQPGAPGKPLMLEAVSGESDRIVLTWEPPADNGGRAITGYRIEVSTDNVNFTERVANHNEMADGAIVRRYVHTGLMANDVRYYRVSAINSLGTGDASDSVRGESADPMGTVALAAEQTVAEGGRATWTVTATTTTDAAPASGLDMVWRVFPKERTATRDSDFTFPIDAGDTENKGALVRFRAANFTRRNVPGVGQRYVATRTGTVQIANEFEAEADEVFLIEMEAVSGVEDWATEGATGEQVTITNDDTWGVQVTASPATIAEGESREVTLTARIAPAGRGCVTGFPVTVGLAVEGTASDPADYTLGAAPAAVEFVACETDEKTWTVRLATKTDTEDDNDETVVFRPEVAGAPAVAPDDTRLSAATVTIQERPGVALRGLPLSLREGRTDTYTVVLTKRPTGTVTVTISVIGDSDVTVSPPQLEFTTLNWNVPQLVTVRAADDADETDDTAELRHSFSGGDYGRVTVRSIPAMVNDTTGGFHGAVRLVGGRSFSDGGADGRVEVFYHGEWGTVCDDRINNPGNLAPSAACRMMGYSDGYMIGNRNSAAFNESSTPIWLDDLRCIAGSNHWIDGPPSRLDQCWHTRVGLHNCEHHEDLWVRCSGDREEDEPLVRSVSALAVTDARAAESLHDALSFEVTLRPALTGTDVVTVDFATAGGTATPVDDYVETSGTLTFSVAATPARDDPTGSTDADGDPQRIMVRQIWVRIVDDLVEDSGETFTVELSNASENAQLADPLATGTIFNHEREMNGVPLTATFVDVPESHVGETFNFELALSEEPGGDFNNHTLQGGGGKESPFSVSGGRLVSAEQIVEGEDRRWTIRIEPGARTEDVTVTLPVTTDCAAQSAVCTGDGRALSEAVSATVPAAPVPIGTVSSATIASDPGANGVWDTGEEIEARVRFSDIVTVTGPPGTAPSLIITLDGRRREIRYSIGHRTNTLVFRHTVTDEDNGARKARVVSNGLRLNRNTIWDSQGREVEIAFVKAPHVTGVKLVADASGDRRWTASETIEARLTFNEAVTVANGRPTVGVTAAGTPLTLSYESGRGSRTLVFTRVVRNSEQYFSEIGVTANSLTLGHARIVSQGSTLATELEHDGTQPTEAPAERPLTARFENVPEVHDGTNAFTFQLRLNKEIAGLSETRIRDFIVKVNNGTVTNARRMTAGSNRDWEVTVEPLGPIDTYLYVLKLACERPEAICTDDGERITNSVRATVASRKFVAMFASSPHEHDGATPFDVKIWLSTPPGGLSYLTVRDGLIDITGGRITRAKRQRRDSSRYWILTVSPDSKEAVVMVIRGTESCDDPHAVCSDLGLKLPGGSWIRIKGPPGLSVADARVYEAAGATVDFVVSLSRASRSRVTVDFATGGGTAVGGEDYTETSGTLTFAPRDTEKTVSVPVINDDHDEGEETLTLTLSNPSGGNAYLADAEATGIIENSDAMPRAWLGRFGRTVAEQVVGAVEGRLGAARKPGVEATLAGERLGGTGSVPEAEATARAEALREAEAQARLRALSGWLTGEGDKERGFKWRAVSERDLLTGTSFALTGGSGAVWARGALTRFDGREGDLSLDGEVASAMLGADWKPGRGTVGLMVSHARGEGAYQGVGKGEVSATLTGLYPYGRYEVSERLTLWGVAGYGAGTLRLTVAGGSASETDMDLWMAAVGGRGVLAKAAAGGGVEIAVKPDALMVRSSSDAASGDGGNLVAAEAEVTRLRVGVEGAWRGLGAGGGALVPRLELGLRHDGGDAETGFGADIGGGFAWTLPKAGISLELSGRGLLTHEDGGLRDRGLAGSFTWDPAPGSNRGPRLSLRQTLGASATGGMETLLTRKTMAELAGSGEDSTPARRRLELSLGYGLALLDDRFTGTPEAGLAWSDNRREYSLGWRLALAHPDRVALDLSLKGTHREPLGNHGTPEHGIVFKTTLRW